MRRRRVWIGVGALAACTFVLSLIVGHAFFENLSLNNDEAVYVLQAKMFASGDVTLSDSAHGDAFRPWMSGRVEGDRLVLVEQPILPALMVVSDALFGTMRVAVALVAAGAVVAIFALARALLDDDRIALAAAGCFVLSPLVIIQSAMYVSYVLAIALAATALTFATRGIDRVVAGRPSRWWFIAAGATEGLLLFTRPLEGIVLGVLLVGWLRVRGGRWGSLPRAALLMGAAVVPVLAMALLYNEFTTGDPLTFALWTIGGDDSFGFGYRAVAEHSRFVYVGPWESWLALRVNLRAFPHWIFGGLASLPLAAWGAWRLWTTSRKVLLLVVAMLVAYPFAYFFYYGNYLIIGGRNFYGPHYYLPLLIPSMILLGVALVDIVGRRWPWITLTAVAIVVGISIEIPDKVRVNARISDEIAKEVDLIRSEVQEPAVVIIPAGVDGPYILHPRGALANPPGLDAETLFAADLGPRDLELVDRFPERAFYRYDLATAGAGLEPFLQRLQVVRGSRLTFRFSVDPAVIGAAFDRVMIGEHAVICAASTTSVTVEGTGASALVTGCSATPTTVPLTDPATTVRVSAVRTNVPGEAATMATTVESVFSIGEVDVTTRLRTPTIATFAPSVLLTPVGVDGEMRPMDPTFAPWFTATVTSD